jgi:hypothetical protein
MNDQITTADPLLLLSDEQLIAHGPDAALAEMGAAYRRAYDAEGARPLVGEAKDILSSRYHRLALTGDAPPPDRYAGQHKALYVAAQVRLLLQMRDYYAAIVAAVQAAQDEARAWVPARPGDPRPALQITWPAFPVEFEVRQADRIEALPPRLNLAEWFETKGADEMCAKLRVVADPNGKERLFARGLSQEDRELLSEYEGAAIGWVKSQFTPVRHWSRDSTM